MKKLTYVSTFKKILAFCEAIGGVGEGGQSPLSCVTSCSVRSLIQLFAEEVELCDLLYSTKWYQCTMYNVLHS